MNADLFYELFKDALNFVGVGFADKENAMVVYRDGMIVVAANEKEARFQLPSKDCV